MLLVYKFCQDNNCFFEFDDFGFCVKDKDTRRILHQGPTENGLYPLHSLASSLSLFAPVCYVSYRSSIDVWHHRLGHPSHELQIAILNNLSILNKQGKFVCLLCQLGKSCKLSFPLTVSKSHCPLEIIHCDIWLLVPIFIVMYYLWMTILNIPGSFL